MEFAATYKLGNEVWEGRASHPQVDTGLGFTCDAGVRDIVVLCNDLGMTTSGSCEAWSMTLAGPKFWIAFDAAENEIGKWVRLGLALRSFLRDSQVGAEFQIAFIYFNGISVTLEAVWPEMVAQILMAHADEIRQIMQDGKP